MTDFNWFQKFVAQRPSMVVFNTSEKLSREFLIKKKKKKSACFLSVLEMQLMNDTVLFAYLLSQMQLDKVVALSLNN